MEITRLHSAPPSPESLAARPPGQVGVLDGLSFKQAFATLVIALGVGLGISGWELYAEYQRLHARTLQSTQDDLQLVRGLAIEAAYQLSADLAGEVVGGLFRAEAVTEVRLLDNFGGNLGHMVRAKTVSPMPSTAERLFGDVTRHRQTLESRAPDGSLTTVGTLELTLDSNTLMNSWLGQVTATIWSGAVRATLLCVLMVAVFYILITKPLLKISAAIGRVDPSKPGTALVSLPRHHDRDELGLLVGNVNAMLTGAQSNLDARDKAEGELASLARTLERRVAERTAELAREKEGVERALAQLNIANAELERASRDINDGIRYASRIQTALLPDQGALAGLVDELAIGWQPLDMVGGDYYWAGTFGNRGVIAVMDCTGHGVPGAFMTAVVASSFSRVLHHHGHDDPAEILTQLNRLVKSALRQDRETAVSNDGLDAGICVIDRGAGTVTWAGANLPLLVGKGGEIELLRGDRMSLGYQDSPEDYRFTSHQLACEPGTAFYLFTDGVIDQVGGENRRLFGRRRLQQMLAENADRPLTEQMDLLFQRLGQWRGDERRRDDMTFVAFRPL
ncbi:Stage II sporulation E [Magnetospirillum sp. LM-5]|nr:Stage II sporulation E [Magnetospirillum sp. LM-5]